MKSFLCAIIDHDKIRNYFTDLSPDSMSESEKEVLYLVVDHMEARVKADYPLADQIRQRLISMGYSVMNRGSDYTLII